MPRTQTHRRQNISLLLLLLTLVALLAMRRIAHVVLVRYRVAHELCSNVYRLLQLGLDMTERSQMVIDSDVT